MSHEPEISTNAGGRSVSGWLAALAPTDSERVDLLFTVVLSILGIIGFRTSFNGGEELLVGIPAVIAGTATGYAVAKRRLPLLPGVAAATAVFVVLSGPLALRHRAIGGFLPSASAVSGLSTGIVDGWKLLLTTLPPAGRAGDLLTIPYLCGFLAGGLAIALAIRVPRVALCALPPTLVLAVGVLMGVKQPASLVLQGALFAAVTIGWVAQRHRRTREIIVSTSSVQRRALGVLLVAVAALVGVVVGPRLPGADGDRFVLRDEVVPPFDPLQEPSAMAGYRRYSNQAVREDEVLTVAGLPAGGRIRISVMDDFDGLVWRSTGKGSVVAGQYLRVGAEIPTDGFGAEREVSVEVHKPHGVWVPLGGDVARITFTGERSDRLERDVRVSIQSDAAAVPGKLVAGDAYTFRAEFVDLPDTEILESTPLDGRFRREEGEPVNVPPAYISRAAEWAGDANTEYAEIARIAARLREEGGFTDGGPEARPVSPPGHGYRRMETFLANQQPFGNGEQFASALGLMARARGIPVRVVLGFVNESGADSVTFRGEDIEAWVEVPVDGYGWVPVDPTPPEDQLPDQVVRPRTQRENPEPQPPPPTTIPPATSIPDELEAEEPEVEDERERSGDSGLAPWLVAAGVVFGAPVFFIGGASLLVVLLKRRRRSRRRTRGSAADRTSGSFDEVVDFARDLGAPVPPRATRVELARSVGTARALHIAAIADAAHFAPSEVTAANVDSAWQEFVEARSELASELTRAGRMRAAVSPTSLRRHV